MYEQLIEYDDIFSDFIRVLLSELCIFDTALQDAIINFVFGHTANLERLSEALGLHPASL